MKNFGRYLYKHLTHTFTPYFVIREDGKPDSSHMVPISEQCLTSMCVRGGFNLKQITVTVAKQLSEVTIALCLQEGRYATGEADLPISGFPRALMSEDIVRSTHQNIPIKTSSHANIVSRPLFAILNGRPQRHRVAKTTRTSPPQTRPQQSNVDVGQRYPNPPPRKIAIRPQGQRDVHTSRDGPRRGTQPLRERQR
jgi:hypothetical protein